jgi:hypothetical protein
VACPGILTGNGPDAEAPDVVATANVEAAATCAVQVGEEPAVLLVADAQYAGVSASQLSNVPWSALVIICRGSGLVGTAPTVETDSWNELVIVQ